MAHEEYKETLTRSLEQVIAELHTIAQHNEQTDDWVAVPAAENLGNADENLEADAVEEWNERRALMAQLEVRYRNIKRALGKIESGTYGTCEISGQPIEKERLQANPAARTNMANMDREKELPV